MRVAVCLSGQLRSIQTAGPAIKAFFGKYNPDYFFHTWSSSNLLKNWNEKLNAWSHSGAIAVEESDIQYALDLFQPKAYRIEKQIPFDFPMSQSQQYSMMIANHLKCDAEIHGRFQYDVVIKCRFDLIWSPEVDFILPNIEHNTLYYSYINPDSLPRMMFDRFFFGNSATMDIVSGIYKETTHQLKTRKINFAMPGAHSGMYPEEILYSYCMDRNIKLHQHGYHKTETIVRAAANGLDAKTQFKEIQHIHDEFFK